MPHTLSWLVDDRVLMTRFHGVITSGELGTFIEEVLTRARTGTPMVHHISDSVALERVEFSLSTARTLLKGRQLVNELGWQIDINRNPINKMFAGIISQFAGVRTRTFPTLQEAFRFLSANDTTLSHVDWEALLDSHKDITISFR